MRVLLVEDDRQIGSAMVTALVDHSYAVDWVQDGEAGYDALIGEEFDIVILDLTLPKMDGLGVLKRIRNEGNRTPIIITTARDRVDDRIMGLDLGADDYLVKPFAISELVARIRALLRRSRGDASSQLRASGIELDLDTLKARKGQREMSLTQKEFALLRVLISRPGKVYSKSELENKLYSWDSEITSNVVEFTIHSLRKKIGKDVIKNIRGLGWVISK